MASQMQDGRKETESSQHTFSFFWTIEKVLYLIDDILWSPDFTVENAGNVSCYKVMLGFDLSQQSFYLSLCRGDVPVSRNCVFSVRNADGSFVKVSGESNRVYLSADNFIEKYTKRNVLTIRCRIWDDESDLCTRVSCHARTVFWTEKIVRSWTLEDFEARDSGREVTLKSASNAEKSFTIELECDTDSAGNERYCFLVRKNFDKEGGFATYCKISILDTRQKIISWVHEMYYNKSHQDRSLYEKIPFMKKSRLLGDRKKNLPNGSLNLRAEIEFPTGCVSSYIEKTKHDEIAKDSGQQAAEPLVLSVEQVTQHVCKDASILYNISA